MVWIIPFSAALSREVIATATASWAAFTSPMKISLSALVMLVLHIVRTDLLRSFFLSVTRTLFSADLMFGNLFLLEL